MTDITILCKVVDNFGDIGFVWRLAKNLHENFSDYKIRIVIDNLSAFKNLCPQVELNLSEQEILGIKIFSWSEEDFCYKEFSVHNPEIILECFQCSRPGWLEKLLFDEGVKNIVQIINIDYLTAEDYAEEFHCLKSGTRNIRVKKINFMPGFTERTGGLVLDQPFLDNHDSKKNTGTVSQILMFNYPKNFVPVINALNEFAIKNGKFAINLARGAGKDSFLDSLRICDKNAEFAIKKNNSAIGQSEFAIKNDKIAIEVLAINHLKFAINELPFLSQENWDKMMCAQDLLFVRGEDSLSRACLCGKPFVWQAYVQDDDYQLVKVSALLQRMERYFEKKDFEVIKKFWLLYNGQYTDKENYSKMLEEACLEFLYNQNAMRGGFAGFADSLFSIGNFTERLDLFIQSMRE